MYLHPRDIDYFLAIASHGRLSAAAAACGVSQPALSKAIQRLEADVGLALFERGIHGSRLTSAGELFHASAVLLQAQHSDVASLALELQACHAGLLRIGTTSVTRHAPAAHALVTLLKRRPALRVTLHTGQSDELNSAVEEGRLDLAVVPAYAGRPFSSKQDELGRDVMVPVVRATHPLLKKRKLQMADLVGYSWAASASKSTARQALTGFFSASALPAPQISLEFSYVTEAVLSMVAATDLIGFVPATMTARGVGTDLGILPLPELHLIRSIVLLSRPNAHWSPLMRAFRDELVTNMNRPGIIDPV